MRRVVALVALLATSWPHVVALECALGSAGTPESAHVLEHLGSPTNTGDGHDHAMGRVLEDASVAGFGAVPCTMVMACGLVMAEAPAAATVAVPRSSPDGHAFRAPRAPSAADLTADPPPPRRPA